MYSVLYECDGEIMQIGPFKTRDEADAEAKKASADGEFDIEDTNVYLMTPDHKMIDYDMDELL